jgi:hypothetical protein
VRKHFAHVNIKWIALKENTNKTEIDFIWQNFAHVFMNVIHLSYRW